MPSANTTQDVIKLQIAAQLAPRRWRRELEGLYFALEQGGEWPVAIDSIRARLPELGHLLSAALAAGDPAGITLALLQHRTTSRTSWRQLVSSLAYPLIMLLAALLVGSLMSMAMLGLVNYTWKDGFFDDFSLDKTLLSRVQEFYDASLGGLFLVAWVCLLIGTAYALASPGAWLKLVGSVPVLGRPYRWMHLSELLTRISVFSQVQPTLEKSLALTEQSFGNQAPAAISRYLAQAISHGEALPNALHKTIVSDARAGIALTLLDPSDISGSAMEASRLVDEMIIATCNQLRMILPVFIMILVGSIIWGAWSSYFELLNSFRAIFFYF